ncbi:MAG: response regulator [Chthoniobacterales bacterium]
MKILIAEDDVPSRRLLETILKNLGHEIVSFADGKQAAEFYANNDISIIISDWMMPVMDGLEFCKVVRADPKSVYTYFILLTAKCDRESYLDAMKAGVDDFLSKPLDSTQLMIRLHVAERLVSHMEHIVKLESMLLTICAWTKQVKVGPDQWVPIDEFLHDQLGFRLTHGISPAAAKLLETAGTPMPPGVPTPPPAQ